MTALTIILAAACALTAPAAALYARGRLDARRRVLRRRIGERVALHLGSGTTLRGVIDRVDGDAIELRNAEHLTSQATTPLAGPQVILHSNWDWFQVLPPAEQVTQP